MLAATALRSESQKALTEYLNTETGATNLALQAGAPGSEKAMNEENKSGPQPVDFKNVWPPGHKESAWCRADSKGLLEELSDDDPVVIRFGE
jgi:hypothetical protein